jgi:diguanylate cyclase (GGDEF)-like protein
MRRLGLVPKFAFLSLVLIALLGFVLARSIGSDVRERNLASAQRLAELVTRLGVQPQLTPEMLTNGLTAQQVGDLDGRLRNGMLGASVVRLKVWNTAGRVVYSDDQSLIGKDFAIDDDLHEALAGHVKAGVSNLDGTENATERRHDTQAFEVYVPIVFAGTKSAAGAFEIYLPYSPIASAIGEDSRSILLMLAAGLGLLWIVLFRFVHRASKQMRQQSLENRHQAMHDSLTDLPNRVLFADRLDQAITLSRRSGTGLAIALMDLDRFKEVNDTLGHHSGDALLASVGARLREAVRESDTVARLGGDEFGVLFAGIGDLYSALELARKLQQALEEPFTVDGLSFEMEASIGIAVFPDHGEDATELLQRADIAMYVAKREHSGVQLYAVEHDEYSRDRLALIAGLRRALDHGELVLYYQPKVDLRSGRVRGVEALVRWQHPERGLVPPDEFIPLAEHTGLIRPLTAYVLEAAAGQCSAWRRGGGALEMSVAVNLSARILHDRGLPEQISKLLERWSLPPSALEIEITESAIMSDPVRAMAVANRLHDLGVGLVIDDFGTGYSSLSYLKQLPVSEIKIDKSFVLDMDSSDNDAAIVRSTIVLGHNLGLKVVAEGIETREVQGRLASLGCDLGQGYLYGRPAPAVELSVRLEGNNMHSATASEPPRVSWRSGHLVTSPY